MKLIVGLGNPGSEYEKTRHNAGFLLIDRLCEKLPLELDKSKCRARYGIFRYKGERIIVAKPQTYMNLSGEAVVSLMHFYGIDVSDLIVVHDDLDLPVGKLRLRRQGSSGGQKGMGNIIQLLGTSKIDRIRIGISNDKKIDTKDYVLSSFSKEDEKILDEVFDKGAEALIYAFDHDFDLVMSKYNG
ncbi:MAG: aminoacyl-tRNA hydrolase [Erysipelotrichaceae bacterium]|nr:aminoacyl-tRNA hydrolase [Erysipelotrichaceae bacterium]